MELINQNYEQVPINTLTPHPQNPRRGQTDQIADSINHHGFYGAIIAQTNTRHILAGNHRYQAAKQTGATTIPVIWVDVDDTQATQIMLADNHLNDLATYDNTALHNLLSQLDTLTGTGYDQTALEELAAKTGQLNQPPPTEEQPLPEPSPEPVTQPGDIWQLGPHRLICADATQPESYSQLLDTPADMIWTDPPYGVNLKDIQRDAPESKHAGTTRPKEATITNDDLDQHDLQELLTKALTLTNEYTKEGGCWYVAAPQGPLLTLFSQTIEQLQIHRQTLIWVKDTFALGSLGQDYHYRHEPILYGWKPGAAHYHINDRTQDTIWEIPRPQTSPEHPSMKPIELVQRAITNSSRPQETILDPFAGSGTTLIAAHNAGRTAHLIEIDPHFCDVICTRYQNHTSTKPTRNNEPHDFTTDMNT